MPSYVINLATLLTELLNAHGILVCSVILCRLTNSILSTGAPQQVAVYGINLATLLAELLNSHGENTGLCSDPVSSDEFTLSTGAPQQAVVCQFSDSSD